MQRIGRSELRLFRATLPQTRVDAMKILRVLAAITVLLAGISEVKAQSYNFTVLGTLGGSQSLAQAINNSGQIVGRGTTIDNKNHAILWDGATVTDLGTLGGQYSNARAINDSGLIVGDSNFRNNILPPIHAVSWNGVNAIDLGTLGGSSSSANSVNNLGQIAGYAETSLGVRHATVWNGGIATDLGAPLGGTSSYAVGINNSGQVAGYAYTPNGQFDATVWSGTSVIDLGTLSGSSSAAVSINDAGQVVGYYTVRGPKPTQVINHAVLWNGATPTFLGTIGDAGSVANAINNGGQVVGWIQPSAGTSLAVIWDGVNATDLNSFLDVSSVSAGWLLTNAEDINDKGQIVGIASNAVTGQVNGFLLTPVPEPETYALLLAGFGLVGFAARRKMQKEVAAY